jgi:hypothetical protein
MQGGTPTPSTFLARPSARVAGMAVGPFGFFVFVRVVIVQSRVTFIANGDQPKRHAADYPLVDLRGVVLPRMQQRALILPCANVELDERRHFQ